VSNPSSPASAEPVFLLIAAGGQGLRMGAGVPKQFRDWGGIPLLQATLGAFFAPGMPALAGIVLAVPEDRLAEVRAWTFPVPLVAVPGGATRQASVARALAALEDRPAARVLIHDAALHGHPEAGRCRRAGPGHRAPRPPLPRPDPPGRPPGPLAPGLRLGRRDRLPGHRRRLPPRGPVPAHQAHPLPFDEPEGHHPRRLVPALPGKFRPTTGCGGISHTETPPRRSKTFARYGCCGMV